MSAHLSLTDGSHVAVIGGGPAGSFFSIFTLQMARMIDRKLKITIYEPKEFTRDGPRGCNRCGGVISEILVQMLSLEGINLPDSVVQRGIDSYKLHTSQGSVSIATPAREKTIATVYRGGGPKGIIGSEKESFDQFLLDRAIEEGAEQVGTKIDRVERVKDKLVLYARGEPVQEADLVAGAFGINSKSQEIFEDMKFGYKRPDMITAALAEVGLDRDVIAECFGNSIHLFLLPVQDLKFGAIIPKGTYVTLCILGRNMDAASVSAFLQHPAVRRVLPKDVPFDPSCRCIPKMNVRAPQIPFDDRVVACGDAGSTRLYKDGIGAAYIMGKAAARTAVFQGIGMADFRRHYYPVYRSLTRDNLYGKFMFAVTDLYGRHERLTRGMLSIVKAEQEAPKDSRKLSSVLWGMFTGSERYREIFRTALGYSIHPLVWKEHARAILGRTA